jgi:hypothetical protein
VIKKILSGSKHQPGDENSVRRFTTPGDATRELYEGFNAWTKSLSDYGLHAAYALIAANWAIHGVAKEILANPWAKYSMVAAVGYLGAHLLAAGCMVLLYKRRAIYADHNKDRWDKEFHDNREKASPWPYTNLIQILGALIQFLNAVGPLTSGACLVASMFV